MLFCSNFHVTSSASVAPQLPFIAGLAGVSVSCASVSSCCISSAAHTDGTIERIIVSDKNMDNNRRFILLPPKVFFIFCPSPRAGFTSFLLSFCLRRWGSRSAAYRFWDKWLPSRHGRRYTATRPFDGSLLSPFPA